MLTKESGTHSIRLNNDKNYLIDIYSNTKDPKVFQIIDINGKKVKELLKSDNPLKDYKLGEMKIGTIKAADNKTDLYYRLIKPADFDPSKKYPVIIYVYGGPHAQMVINAWNGGARLWHQYMAEKGYVMFTLDNRGSSNRGFEFESIIHRNVGKVEMADQMKGIEFLKSLPYVDTSKIGIHGWSYGGFMTTSLMLEHNDILKLV